MRSGVRRSRRRRGNKGLAILLGAILAVVLIFWNTIWPFALAKNTNFSENLGRRGFWNQKYWMVGPIAVKMEIIMKVKH